MSRRATLRYLRRAQEDLLGILDYIARADPRAAHRFVDELDERLRNPEHFPEMGTLPRDPRLRIKGYRVIVFREYLVFYRMNHGEVRVCRVLHGRRRYQFLL